MAENPDVQKRLQHQQGGRPRQMAWYEWSGLALWIGAMAFCAQFAFASAQELEGQAAILGWVLVAILLFGGLAVWGTYFHSAKRHRNR